MSEHNSVLVKKQKAKNQTPSNNIFKHSDIQIRKNHKTSFDFSSPIDEKPRQVFSGTLSGG